ncbi:MAG: lipoate--protein ligase [Aerococcus sp.]|nr:lipoate--protein ligase [Aerococcus sp.]
MYLIEIARHGVITRKMGEQMAAQEYVLNHIKLDDDILLPYRCEPSIQIGKYQNTIQEINVDYVEKHHLPIIRRETGGGAIYMDMGAANFIFISDHPASVSENFRRIYAPAISGLEALGATNVSQRGRNDLEIEGHKISGAAQTVTNGRLYAGYSLLMDIDGDAMAAALRPNRKKIASKGIQSVRKRVGGIRPYLAEEYQHISVDDFEELMLKHFLEVDDLTQAKRYELTDKDWEAIDALYAEKYGNWEWNYGASPHYSYQRDARFSAGTVDIQLEVENGQLTQLKIYGDFFGKGEIKDVEEALTGVTMRREDLLQALNTIALDQYMSGIEPEELVDLILDQHQTEE